MNTRSPSTIGLDAPGPGISAFHTMFSLDDHFAVQASRATPRPSGPRNCVQSSAAAKRPRETNDRGGEKPSQRAEGHGGLLRREMSVVGWDKQCAVPRVLAFAWDCAPLVPPYESNASTLDCRSRLAAAKEWRHNQRLRKIRGRPPRASRPVAYRDWIARGPDFRHHGLPLSNRGPCSRMRPSPSIQAEKPVFAAISIGVRARPPGTRRRPGACRHRSSPRTSRRW